MKRGFFAVIPPRSRFPVYILVVPERDVGGFAEFAKPKKQQILFSIISTDPPIMERAII